MRKLRDKTAARMMYEARYGIVAARVHTSTCTPLARACLQQRSCVAHLSVSRDVDQLVAVVQLCLIHGAIPHVLQQQVGALLMGEKAHRGFMRHGRQC
jgi:hypothetical protein